ncbi:MAG: DivIVA domain-containing protein [Nitrospinales bacterium]
MRFTHLDILEQCFHEKFRGYSKQEVDTFLHLVADDFKDMEEEIENLKNEVGRKDRLIQKLQQAQDKKSNGNDPLGGVSPEVIGDKARRIILFAREKAEQQKKKAARELARLQEEIKKLKQEKKRLLQPLKAGAKNRLQSLPKKTSAANPGNAPGNKNR